MSSRAADDRRPLLLLTLIDAWRHDMCSNAVTPFLAGLRASGAGGAMMETLGFNTGPAIFAGIYPEVSNQIQKFWYEPELSPYAFTRWIPEPLLRLPRGGGRLMAWIDRTARARLTSRGVTAARHLADFERVPYRFRRFFNLVETRNHYEPGCVPADTVFDVLRAHDRRFLWIGVPDHPLEVATNVETFERAFDGSQDLVFVHWAEPDWIGHAEGPDSGAYAAKLAEVDRALERLAGRLRATGRPVAVLAFGDHGLVSVRRRVDLASELARLPVRAPDDYVYFLDSTMARFWFPSAPGWRGGASGAPWDAHARDRSPARRAVEEALARLGCGRPLGDDDRARYRLPGDDPRHWHLCWVLEAGCVIAPDFFHPDPDRPVRGMHGYLPEVGDNQAAWVLSGDLPAAPRPGGAVRCLVDVAPTVLDVLGLPVPRTCQGTSLMGGA
jgi:hypothetical protein